MVPLWHQQTPRNVITQRRFVRFQRFGSQNGQNFTAILLQRSNNKKDIFNYGGNSEFYGLEYSEQLSKIKSGLQEFNKRNIKIRSFFAPNHIYDENTLKALKVSGIKIVIDGYGLFPYFKDQILFVPQLFYKEVIFKKQD